MNSEFLNYDDKNADWNSAFEQLSNLEKLNKM